MNIRYSWALVCMNWYQQHKHEHNPKNQECNPSRRGTEKPSESFVFKVPVCPYCFFTNPHPGTEENLPVPHSLNFNFLGGVRQKAVEVVDEADHWLLIEEGV
jgi:hypothetical protein